MVSSNILSSLPPIFILPTHLTSEEQFQIEDELVELGGQLTYDAKEARVFLGRITQKKRANFDLRARGIWTEELNEHDSEPAKKRRRTTEDDISDVKNASERDSTHSSTMARTLGHVSSPSQGKNRDEVAQVPSDLNLANTVLVLKLDWLQDCSKSHSLVPFASYTTYRAKIIPKPPDKESPSPVSEAQVHVQATSSSLNQGSSTATADIPRNGTKFTSILSRARAEASNSNTTSTQPFLDPHTRRRFNQTTTPNLTHPTKPPKLHRTTTSEFENLDSRSLPPPPDWVRDHDIYSCRRSTPLNPVNAAFLRQLYVIKESRLLTLDEIGVRAYSTAIASIAAYPYLLSSAAEVSRLPGCETKIAALWSEWASLSSSNTSSFTSASSPSLPKDPEQTHPTVLALEANEELQTLRRFFNIHGVGADTARKFALTYNWHTIDDVVEFGWHTHLTRAQQIGVKFYDDFLLKIPRSEVESIAETVLKHARACRGIPDPIDTSTTATEKQDEDNDMHLIIVGGYRRGKPHCGDVDVILSHRDERVTRDLVVDVVASLEEAGYVTHTLTLHTTTSRREGATLPYRDREHGGGKGGGFDSLDKALCVWQDPVFESGGEGEGGKNPNVHRRVDIIVSSWRTVGCAVLGWSGGTTFERDVRRWCKRVKGWKFDSSGVRDRTTGLVLDLESPRREGEGDTWLDREKRLMEGLGIGWREPTERCTG